MGEWNAPHLSYVDNKIMPLIDLCNVACGAHAGSEVIMKHTINLARKNDVKVGAHPGYNDPKEFGRNYVIMDRQNLTDLVQSQIDLFLNCCSTMNVTPHHVKPHGALYHACQNGELETEVLLDLMKNQYPELKLFVSPNSALSDLASKENIFTLRESFLDRSYNNDLTLMSRNIDGSVIVNNIEALDQYHLLSKGQIRDSSGSIFTLISDSACIHGDNPNVLSILKTIRNNGKI